MSVVHVFYVPWNFRNFLSILANRKLAWNLQLFRITCKCLRFWLLVNISEKTIFRLLKGHIDIEFEVFLIVSYCVYKRKDRIFPTIMPMKDGKKLIYATKKIYVVLREVANAASSSTMCWSQFLKKKLLCFPCYKNLALSSKQSQCMKVGSKLYYCCK